MNENIIPPPGFEQFADLPRRFNSGLARASELHGQGHLQGEPDLGFVRRLIVARTELDNRKHRRSAKTIRRALECFDREVAIFEAGLDSLEARLPARPMVR